MLWGRCSTLNWIHWRKCSALTSRSGMMMSSWVRQKQTEENSKDSRKTFHFPSWKLWRPPPLIPSPNFCFHDNVSNVFHLFGVAQTLSAKSIFNPFFCYVLKLACVFQSRCLYVWRSFDDGERWVIKLIRNYYQEHRQGYEWIIEVE